MIVRKSGGALSEHEKHITKALLRKNWRNPDIQALINLGRADTINSARITEVKQDSDVPTASDDIVAFFS